MPCLSLLALVGTAHLHLLLLNLEESVNQHPAPHEIRMVVLDLSLVSLVSLWTFDGAAVLTENLRFSAK